MILTIDITFLLFLNLSMYCKTDRWLEPKLIFKYGDSMVLDQSLNSQKVTFKEVYLKTKEKRYLNIKAIGVKVQSLGREAKLRAG